MVSSQVRLTRGIPAQVVAMDLKYTHQHPQKDRDVVVAAVYSLPLDCNL
jgi:hypothetical protein